jgi:hypothetical protein
MKTKYFLYGLNIKYKTADVVRKFSYDVQITSLLIVALRFFSYLGRNMFGLDYLT